MQDYFHQFTFKQASLQHQALNNFRTLAQHYHEGKYNETHTSLIYKSMLKIYTMYKWGRKILQIGWEIIQDT